MSNTKVEDEAKTASLEALRAYDSRRKVTVTSISMTPEDRETLNTLSESLGISRSKAAAVAIRYYARLVGVEAERED